MNGKCKQCGKPLTKDQIRKGGKFCGTACSIEFSRKPVKPRTCLNCGKQIPEKQIKKQRGVRFCSTKCFHEYRGPKVKPKYCLHWGKPLTISQIKRNPAAKFCSMDCTHQHISDHWERGYNTEFMKTDSELSAYFMGLWITDGHLNKEKRASISSSDRQIVHQLAWETDYENNISGKRRKDRDNKLEYTLNYGKPIAEEIMKMGYKPGKKTGKEFLPERFSEEPWFHHILRGIIDGDGGFSVKKQNQNDKEYRYLSCYICNVSRSMLGIIRDKLKALGIIRGEVNAVLSSKTKNEELYRISFSHWDSVQIGKFIYRDVTIFLKRKRLVFEKMKDKEMTWEIQKGLICKVKGCNEPVRAKGYCKLHYDRKYIKIHGEEINAERRRRTKEEPEYREKVNKQARESRERNRDKKIVKGREYYNRNKDELNRRRRERRKNDPEYRERINAQKRTKEAKDKKNKRRREDRKENPEKYRKWEHDKYERNKDRISEHQQDYYFKNRNKKLKKAAERRKKKRGKKKSKKGHKAHAKKKRKCEYCGKIIVGNAYFVHVKACAERHRK